MDDACINSKLAMQGFIGVVVHGVVISCIATPNILVLPRGIKVLHKSCFSGMDNLFEITLPSTIESIEDNCFANCPNLVLIRCKGDLRRFERKLKHGNEARVVYVCSSRQN